jgi:hypothetical protein
VNKKLNYLAFFFNIKISFVSSPCAMVVPDFDLISEIMMVAEGFTDARLLARKFITLYSLCKELLSKQVCLFDELNEKKIK